MTPADFTRLLDTCGADLKRWPDDVREAGEAFLAGSSEGRAAWAIAQRLDALIARDRDTFPDSARTQTIVDAAMRRNRGRPTGPSDWRWLIANPLGAVFASVALAGFITGCLTAPVFDSPRAPGVPAAAVLLGEAGPVLRELF